MRAVSPLDRFAALGEVLFVLLLANGVVLALRVAGFTPALFGVSGDVVVLDAHNGIVEGLFIFLKFTVMLLVGLLLLKWLFGLGPRAVGIARGGSSNAQLVTRGCVLACVAALPWLVIMAANSVFQFGEGVDGWRYVEQAPKNLGFLVYVVCTMLLIPPVMEELTMRGYMRMRLHLAFGPVGAALVSSVVFVFAHGHFYGADVVLVSSQFAFLFGFTVLAYDTYRSGSIIPAIVAHALINVPFPRSSIGLFTALAIAVVVLVLVRRPVCEGFAQFRSDWADTEGKRGVALWSMVAAGLMISTVLYLPLAAIMAVFAVAGLAVSIRRRPGPGERQSLAQPDH